MKSLHHVPAPGKLNLFLHITGRRADGYHLLQSAFMLIDWWDVLHFDLREDGQLLRQDLGEPLPALDLCLKAAQALQKASGTSQGTLIRVQKNLPSEAGLGGGSSDAATTLLALNRLWGLNWPLSRLLPLGASLGADVPFFFRWSQRLGSRHWRTTAGNGLAACRANVLHHRIGTITVDIHHTHRAAFLRKTQCPRAAHAGGCGRDEADLVCQSHVLLPSETD